MTHRIGCDMDGILVDFAQYWTSLIRSMYRDTELPLHTHTDMPSYDLQKHYPDLRGRIKAVRQIFYQTPNVWEYMPSLLSVKQWERLGRLMRGKWEFYFITARKYAHRGNTVAEQTAHWLEKQLQGAMLFGITHGPIRVRVCPYDEPVPQKPDVCHELGISLMIDDHPLAIEALTDAGIQVLMRVYGYNTHINDPRVWRAKDFDTILDFLESVT